jgi:hypothetical protein
MKVMERLASKLRQARGAALIIDYGAYAHANLWTGASTGAARIYQLCQTYAQVLSIRSRARFRVSLATDPSTHCLNRFVSAWVERVLGMNENGGRE